MDSRPHRNSPLRLPPCSTGKLQGGCPNLSRLRTDRGPCKNPRGTPKAAARTFPPRYRSSALQTSTRLSEHSHQPLLFGPKPFLSGLDSQPGPTPVRLSHTAAELKKLR